MPFEKKNIANFEKLVLGSYKSPLGGYLQGHRFWSQVTLSDDTLSSKIRLMIEKLFKIL